MDKSNENERVMLLCAHPDDEALGAGGTIASYMRAGKEVIIVIFTDGESSHPWQKKEVLTKIRREEIISATNELGGPKLIHLGLQDGKLTLDIKKPVVLQLLSKLLEQYKPHRVFTHSRDDMLYPDHVAVHKSVLHAVDSYNAAHPEKIEVYTFNIWGFSLFGRSTPQLVVDISETFEHKTRALAKFSSQKLALAQLWPTVIIKAIGNGLKTNTRYAEAFYKIR
jgi:LmbE family N-acetylglucosaminyl deacetylase